MILFNMDSVFREEKNAELFMSRITKILQKMASFLGEGKKMIPTWNILIIIMILAIIP